VSGRYGWRGSEIGLVRTVSGPLSVSTASPPSSARLITQGITPLSSDQLLVTLSSLTCHLITHISTDPALAPMEQSLALSLSARDVSLEEARAQYLESHRRVMKPEHERAVTAHTQGFARAGDRGGVFSWAFE
jgi:hypothetical protein